MTTTLTVLGRYRSAFGSFEVGQELVLPDEDAQWLLRDSPGSFALAGSVAHVPAQPVAEPAGTDDDEEEEDDFDPTGAMSTETALGITVPDRRARGGRRRS